VSEEIEIPGTTHKLVYSSDRAEQTGRTRLDIVGADVPEGLQYAQVRISVAGQTAEYILPPQANQQIVHEFDGKNAWGGAVYGPQRLDIEVTYYYPTFYYEPDVALDDVHTPPPAFGLLPRKFIEPRVPARVLDGTRITATTYVTKSQPKAVPSLANGWSLNAHHRLDVITGNVFLGTGGVQTNDITAEKLPHAVGYTSGVAPLPNGAVVYQDAYEGALYYWDKNSTQGPPRILLDAGAKALTADQRGNIYFLHEQRIKRWRSATNTIEIMAGNGQVCPANEQECGDAGPALDARLHLASTLQTVVRLGAGGTAVETLYDVVYDDGGANGRRDAIGRLLRKTERIVEGDIPRAEARPIISKRHDYAYNPEGRPWLESVAVNGTLINSYRHDPNGNRIAAELTPSLLGYDDANDLSLSEEDTEYDAADKLLRYGTKSYTWNNFGQLASVTDSDADTTTAYEYDLYGNLLSVALPDGRTIEYDVDGAGRRVGRRVVDAAGNGLEFRGWIHRDLLRPIAEVDAMGNVVARYVYADGDGARQNGVGQLATRLGANQDTSLPFSGSNVPEFIEMLSSSGAVTQRLRLITNQVGTVEAVVDVASGAIVQRLEYDEFGRVLSDSNPGLQPFGFAGGLTDKETRLVRFGARDYSPEVGRWTSKDPIRWASGQQNFYLYARADPINLRDSTGLATEAQCPTSVQCESANCHLVDFSDRPCRDAPTLSWMGTALTLVTMVGGTRMATPSSCSIPGEHRALQFAISIMGWRVNNDFSERGQGSS